MDNLPEEFVKRLESIIPAVHFDDALRTFSRPDPVCIRVNTIKASKEKVQFYLRRLGIRYEQVPWYHDALVLPQADRRVIADSSLAKNGFIFIQGLSSMLVPLILDPKPGETVLDMCAAPGGKATQMAALMQNRGEVLALETVRPRFFKLKSVITLLDATIVHAKLTDARRFGRGVTQFDRVLIDAPCSSEGRFKTGVKKTIEYWSLRKIKEMAKKQKDLLENAVSLLKPGGVMVYSTCTFAPEENEVMIDRLLMKTGGKIKVIQPDNFPIHTYPALTEWRGKPLDEQLRHCIRILPTDIMPGFFIAKLMKL